MRFETFKRYVHKGHFFDADTMRFFASKVLEDFWSLTTGYFLTSEKKCFDDNTRVFSVRKANFETGDVATIESQIPTRYLAIKRWRILVDARELHIKTSIADDYAMNLGREAIEKNSGIKKFGTVYHLARAATDLSILTLDFDIYA